MWNELCAKVGWLALLVNLKVWFQEEFVVVGNKKMGCKAPSAEWACIVKVIHPFNHDNILVG